MARKRGQRSATTGPTLTWSGKGKWFPKGDLAEKSRSKSARSLPLFDPLNASSKKTKKKKRSYVSACNFKFKRTPGPSAEVDSDIW